MAGLPDININFSSKATAAVKQGDLGMLALVMKDEKVTEGVEVIAISSISDLTEDVKSKISDVNLAYVKDALSGTPKKVYVVLVANNATDFVAAHNRLETLKIDTVAFPGSAAAQLSDTVTWVKDMRDKMDKKLIAVLADCEANHEGVVNLTTKDIQAGETKKTATEYTARVAGLIAGLPLTVAPTYQVLPEVTGVETMTKSVVDGKIGNGELVLYYDGEKVKIARGVTSLTQPTEAKSAEWMKIKLVRIYDKVYTDIKRTIEDSYIGVAQNSYNNKILLMGAINAYLQVLENANILDPGKNACTIDLVAQKNYLKGIGTDVDSMSDQEIKEANTRDQVFLKMNIKALDAIEDVSLDIII